MPPKKRRRRAKGEGGLHQRADGMWIATIQLPNGRRYQKGRKKYQDAVAVLDEMRSDLKNGVLPNTGTLTVSQWMDTWLSEIAAPRLKPRTLATYRSAIRHQITPSLGSKKLATLTPADVRKMVKVVGAENSTRTAQAAYNILSKALSDAVKEGKLRSNPCERMDRPQALSEARKPLTVSDVKVILGYLVAGDDHQATARWTLSLLTGARQAEVLGLTWDRVDLTAGVMDIEWQLARLKLKKGPRPTTPVYPKSAFDVPATFDFTPIHQTACLVPTKTRGSQRLVPLLAPAVAALTAHWDASGRHNTGLVFRRADGAAVLPRDDTTAWKELCVATGVAESLDTAPDQHAGRHTVATLLQEAGVEEATRMALLGHTTSTAHRAYAHVSTDLTRAALGQLGTILALDT